MSDSEPAEPGGSTTIADRSEPEEGPARARRLFRYLAGEEWLEYRAIMEVFAGTFFAELSPRDVVARLVEQPGEPVVDHWDSDVVQARLESLRGWGNLTVSTSVGNPSSLEDYYRRRNLYLITREGQEVHELVEGVLNRADEVSDMQTGRLRAIHQGLVALDRMVEADLASASPTELADAIRLVFDAHEAFTYEITQFFASLNQWQSRYDLDGDELQFFAEILVGYVSEQLHEIERLARPIALVLADLEPVLDQLIARADAGLAKRVDDAGLTGKVAVRALAGTQRRDWDYLSSWYRSGPSSRSRLDELTSQAVQAVRTLTANLTRLSGAGMGSASRRSDFVKLARWIDQAATIEDAHRLVAAAFGLGPSRHLGAVAADDDDPVPTTTPWADAPRAVVPVSVRQRGETTMRGRPTRMRDRSADREVLRLRRQRLAEAARRTTAELLASAGPDGSINGSKLSAAAFVRLRDLIGRSSHHLRAGQPVRRFSDGELVCEVSRRSGAETTVETDDGRLRMIDVEVRVGPAGAGAGGHSG